MKTVKRPVLYLIENSIILVLVAYKKDRSVLKGAFDLLTQEQWYVHFTKHGLALNEIIKEKVALFQKKEYDELHDIFIKNTHLIQRDVPSEHYRLFTRLLESIVSLSDHDQGEDRLLDYHKSVFSFIRPTHESPMFTLSYKRFYEYIEALIIYAAIDNIDFYLHQNESMLILNEIRSYIKNKPMDNVKASELFFPILELARKNSKNHISTRFEGLVKANLKAMNDEQDAYFLEKLKELSRVDGAHSVQERLFDSIITASVHKVSGYEKKEREGMVLLQELSLLRLPFSSEAQLVLNVRQRLPRTPQEAISLLWKWIEQAIREHFSALNIIDITKKTLFILSTEGYLKENQFEYLVRLRQFVGYVSYINWDQNKSGKIIDNMAVIYIYFKRSKV